MPVKKTPRAYRSALREAAADETRARIVAAARALLAGGEGLPPFSLDAVARQAGVTRLTVYNQFESKLGLLEAVFDQIAQEGGLTALPSLFAVPDAAVALRRLVGVFCRFWAQHGLPMRTVGAISRLDPDVSASLKRRTERRRHLLAALVQRLMPPRHKANADLVDVLFALTSFEMFESLAVRRRSAKAIEALIVDLVEHTLARERERERERAGKP